MKVGCVKEIKNNEFRVGMTPDNVKSYVNAGHDVYIEKGAGEGSGFLDAEYVAAGAKMIDTAKEVWDTVEMMIKVKEPLPEEYPLFHGGIGYHEHEGDAFHKNGTRSAYREGT